MIERAHAGANLLSRIADDAPGWLAPAFSIGGRLAGAAMAVYVATDQSYDRTQVVATAVAVLAVASLAPVRGISSAIAAFTAGMLLFAGAALGAETPTAGIAMLIAGAVSAVGVLMASHRAGESPLAALVAFFASLPVMVAGIAVVALLVEG